MTASGRVMHHNLPHTHIHSKAWIRGFLEDTIPLLLRCHVLVLEVWDLGLGQFCYMQYNFRFEFIMKKKIAFNVKHVQTFTVYEL